MENKKNKSRWIKILKIGSLVAAGFVIILTTITAYFYFTLPNPENFGERIVAQSTKILDRTGKTILYEIHGEEKRTIIPLKEIPLFTQKALLAAEDAEFYNHPAFNIKGIIRGVIFNPIFRQTRIQGGSTITQQLAKNVFLSNERTVIRKIKELILAIRLEKNYSKDQILELYLNQIPYGSNAYGIESASQTFFAKSAKDLTLAQSALLAGIIQAPSYYSPYGSHTKELLKRKDFILDRMNQLGFISDKETEAAKKEKMEFQPKFSGIKAPHFVMFVKEYLEEKYGADVLETAGLKVTTTLDWDMQQIAEKAVYNGAKRNEELYKGKNAALMTQDATNGQILAMVGSRDYFDIKNEGNFNVITAHRQPGSSFKPFVYLSSFKKGYSPDTILFDLKTEFNPNCSWTASDEKDQYGLNCYHPQNYDHKFRGPMNLRNSLAQSINVTAVKLLYLVGLKDALSTANTLGITTLTDPNKYGLSLVLGGGDVRPIEMVQAYSILAQDGTKHKQTAILKVEDREGKVLEEYKDENEKVFDSQPIRLINDVLSDNQARIGLFNANNPLEISGHQIAAKTGTTQDYRDAWVFGYTPSLVTGVWAGNNDFSPMQKEGGSILAAVPIWNAFMTEVLKNKPEENFPKPEQYSPEKPMLRGEYLSYLKSVNNDLLPQIHNILFWIDKNDPLGPIPNNPENDTQFNNWEKPVLEWIKNSIPNPEQYNKPANKNENVGSKQAPTLNIISPQNGDYVKNGKIKIKLEMQSSFGIKTTKILFNGKLKSEINNPSTMLEMELNVSEAESQNQLEIKVSDNLNNETKQTLVVFSE